jgi:hypothetical protein
VPDTYTIAATLAKHVEQVVVHLAAEIGVEAAIFRVMDHLTTVLQDALEGGRADDMAQSLRPSPPT